MEDFDIKELSRFKRETEKKLRDLEKLVSQKNETIRKLKFKLLDQINLCEVAEQRLEEALKAQRKAEIWKNDIAEMSERLSDDGMQALERDRKLDEREMRIRDRENELKKKEEELSEREQRIEQKDKFLSDVSYRQKREYIFMGAVLLVMWCISGLITDLKNCWDSYAALRGFFHGIREKTVFPLNVLAGIIPVFLILLIAGCVVFGIYRIIQRYIDLTSLRVLFGSVLAAILIRILLGWNSVCIFVIVTVVYAIARSVIDAHDPRSEYSKY
mgnify:CR=1 FL=1